jgi:hypothetical protein
MAENAAFMNITALESFLRSICDKTLLSPTKTNFKLVILLAYNISFPYPFIDHLNAGHGSLRL